MTDKLEKYFVSIPADMGPTDCEPHRFEPTFLNRLASYLVAGLRYVSWEKT